MADRVLTELEQRVLRVLLDSDRRWLRASDIADQIVADAAAVQSALSALRRANYVTPSYHVRSAITYAATGLGEDAMCPQVLCGRPASECGPQCVCPPCRCSRCRARTAKVGRRFAASRVEVAR